MHCAERLTLRDAHSLTPWPVPEAVRIPPLIPVAAGGLSGRPRCRIFPVGRLWILHMETASAWFIGEDLIEPPPRFKFPTLAAAVAHAEWHGYDYRIINPAPVARLPDRGRRAALPERPSRFLSDTAPRKTEH